MPEEAIAFNALDMLFEPNVEQKENIRGRDRAKLVDDTTWVNVERIHEFDDGWYVGYCGDPADTATLGKLMGHCAGTHYVWTYEEKIWYFFALFDPSDVPRTTIHAKQASWINKPHPRDNSEPFPEGVDPYRGGGIYPTLEHVESCFAKAGLKYEPGKYCVPNRYNSRTYDYALEDARYGGGNIDAFAYRYGPARTCENRPDNVDAAVWDAYVKAAKAVEDNHDKNVGAVKVVGRRFKFDGKWLILLSSTNKSQMGAEGAPGKRVAEWLNSLGKKKEK